ncbi:hypothetical protein GOBAR_AA19611 [Gossypium barbadense]|uniref:Uncharacterized protein n=1 Tax=Gossypium barbadense TaxID=3634 RepID=A0A2P5XCK2_GOSBA|nr:hypothetical protein GOBAR_AA19611 [Gossypium barbadense]
MLMKFISVLETRFQNTKTTLKNQQASIQGLENQISQLAKPISERPQGSLPSNTETNLREQLHAITVRDEEGLVESEPELRTTHEERMLQIDKLDEWRTHVKENLRIQDAEPKRRHDGHKDETNQFKVGDQVLLLDKMNHQIATAELNANGETPFTVLNVFPTVQ